MDNILQNTQAQPENIETTMNFRRVFGRLLSIWPWFISNIALGFVRLNLNTKEIFNSSYYYLKQNDVLYVEPNKGKVATLNQARTHTVAVTGTILTVLATIVSRLFLTKII